MSTEVSFVKGTFEKVKEAPIKDGQILITEDTGEMYVDVNNETRKQIGNTSTNLQNGTINKSLYQQSEKTGDPELSFGFTDLVSRGIEVPSGTHNRETETGINAISLGTSLATGKRSFAMGSSNIAGGNGSTPANVAMGKDNYAKGDASFALGYANYTQGNYSMASGSQTQAIGVASHTEGINNIANGKYSHAEGATTITNGIASHTEGNQTIANGDFSHAEGELTEANHKNSHSGGLGTKTSATEQTVIGRYNADNENALFIVGNGGKNYVETTDTEPQSGKNYFIKDNDTYIRFTNTIFAEGVVYYELERSNAFVVNATEGAALNGKAVATEDYVNNKIDGFGNGFKILSCSKFEQDGYENIGVYTLSSIEGLSSGQIYYASLKDDNFNFGTIVSIIDGANTIVVNNYKEIPLENQQQDDLNSGKIFNYFTIVNRPDLGDTKIAYNSTVLGRLNQARSDSSFAAGSNNTAIGKQATVFGDSNIAVNHALATGYKTYALGSNSSTFGMKTKTLGEEAIAEGTHTVAFGNNSFASGYGRNEVTLEMILQGHLKDKDSLKAIWLGTTGIPDYSVYKQTFNIAYGHNSTTAGVDNLAAGDQSMAVGQMNLAEGDNTFVTGYNNIADVGNQTVVGQFNATDSTAKFIVGNGTSEEDRENAFVIKNDGTLVIGNGAGKTVTFTFEDLEALKRLITK